MVTNAVHAYPQGSQMAQQSPQQNFVQQQTKKTESPKGLAPGV